MIRLVRMVSFVCLLFLVAAEGDAQCLPPLDLIFARVIR
jgi:hypothetical protein